MVILIIFIGLCLTTILFVCELQKAEAIINFEQKTVSTYDTSNRINNLSKLEFILLIILCVVQIYKILSFSFVVGVCVLVVEIYKRSKNECFISPLDLFDVKQEKKMEVYCKMGCYLYLFFYYIYQVCLFFSRKIK
ncbi:putative cornichon transmembrane protein [Hamiltosporidium magnivora]|uniref:Putative cornichon transmembrane protein n=1 Tax=Hamiltosporidium magnivora TaxID=148818 RepID=A0A4Q9LEH2_9MICR|nr:putative cornichon transmembrane protein [Hamiltosporidium magnivora]